MSWSEVFSGIGFMTRCWFLAFAALYGAGHSVADGEPWINVAGWVVVAVLFAGTGWWRR